MTTYYRDERVLVMCNHQSTADVPTFMTCLQSKGVASRKVGSLLFFFYYFFYFYAKIFSESCFSWFRLF